MKLERIQEYVVPVVATLCGMGFAFYVGQLMGQGQFIRVAMLLGILFLGFLTMVMRQYIWLLIVVAWPWSGVIPGLPMSMSGRDVAVFAVFGAFLMLKALKVARRKPNYTLADLLMFLILAYLVTAFARNPVGVLAMNTERIGGRPYFNIGIACLAYWILSRSSIPLRSGAKIVIFTILGSNYVLGAMNLIADVSPRAARFLTQFYMGLSVVEESSSVPTAVPAGETVERLVYLGHFGNPTMIALASFFRPFTLITPLYLIRFTIFLISLGCIMLSGFRSALLAAGFYFAVSSYLRAGWMELVRLGAIGLFGLIFLVAGQGRLFDLPLSAQRSLTFLPGKWSYAAVESAKSSSEWRYEMWRVFLTGNKYVRNQILGDGFGMTKRDLAAISWLHSRGGGDSRESAMIAGNIHNGPLSAIRYVGYVGLVIFLSFLVVLALQAWRLIRLAQPTHVFPLALFVGLPLIYEPFNFVFIFGAFEASLPTSIFALGMLKMVENTISDYRGEPNVAALGSPPRVDPQAAFAGASR